MPFYRHHSIPYNLWTQLQKTIFSNLEFLLLKAANIRQFLDILIAINPFESQLLINTMAPRSLYQAFRIGFLLVSTFQTLNWLKKNCWGCGCTYFRSQGRLVYPILAVNSSYHIQDSPILFALRSSILQGA